MILTRKAMVELWRQMMVLLEILNVVKADYDQYLLEALGKPSQTRTRHRKQWHMKDLQLAHGKTPLGFGLWAASPDRADSPNVVIIFASDCRSVLRRIGKILRNHPTLSIRKYQDGLYEGDTGKWYLELLVTEFPNATLFTNYIALPDPPKEREDAAGHQPERA